eukprot:6180350-Pleurochrysis_carterae.AAC.1
MSAPSLCGELASTSLRSLRSLTVLRRASNRLRRRRRSAHLAIGWYEGGQWSDALGGSCIESEKMRMLGEHADCEVGEAHRLAA